MNARIRKVRCGFVLIKLSIGGAAYVLMRRDPGWKDVNFIGGHEKTSDGGSLQRTAWRECLEEVPTLRGEKRFHLEPLGAEITYGPTFSHSAGRTVEYKVAFFSLMFHENPQLILKGFGRRSLNVWIPQEEVLIGRKHRISGFARILEETVPGGLRAIPFSWPEDLRGSSILLRREGQQELAL